jgi:hypothetical protein
MKALRDLLIEVENLKFSSDQRCIESLDNYLQDLIMIVKDLASGELLELKGCSWTLHERYHMDDEAELKWTFHHTKHRILKNGTELLQRMEKKMNLSTEETDLKKTA